jgi:hypothetical protein
MLVWATRNPQNYDRASRAEERVAPRKFKLPPPTMQKRCSIKQWQHILGELIVGPSSSQFLGVKAFLASSKKPAWATNS